LCSLSLSLALNSNQRNVKEKEIASCWSPQFLSEYKEEEEKEKRNTWYLCSKT
jgi:hypothetical protein